MSVSNSLDWKRLFHQIKIIFILLCAVSYHIWCRDFSRIVSLLYKKYYSDFFKDSAIIKLYSKFPNNTDLDEVLAKVTLLNAFYSTQILDMDLLNVSRDIVELNIDSSIHGEKVDYDIVNRIAYGGIFYQRKLYSFASKFCSFHNPAEFPIVDSYSKGMLYYMNNCEDSRFHFFTHGFTQNDLNNYHNYCKVYNAFVKHFKLENISYKEIDKYLWKYAKYEMGSKIQITDTTVYLDRLI